ncbi:MAG: hypothetical protein KZQ99_13930 [Candidatus Thiodiazotropha sp. (ex Dulcina madagascariensis)]|nr:hypothetical protein [Candidatus Thiodiazotropha sp. (ex Dulcina madagascariensis)]
MVIIGNASVKLLSIVVTPASAKGFESPIATLRVVVSGKTRYHTLGGYVGFHLILVASGWIAGIAFSGTIIGGCCHIVVWPTKRYYKVIYIVIHNIGILWAVKVISASYY